MAVLKDNEGNVLASVDEPIETPNETIVEPTPRRKSFIAQINTFDGEVATKVGEKLLVAAKDIEEFVKKGIIKLEK